MIRGPVGVLGLGLIGGSVAAGLRRSGVSVWGFDLDDRAAREARRLGYVDEVLVRPTELGACELVFVAVPPARVTEVLPSLQSGGAIVTDGASVKSPVLAWARDNLPEAARRRFVGGHPMAGFERSGIEHARADLFTGAPWILTPLQETEPGAVESVAELARTLGAYPVTMDPESHDAHVALLSHVPHLLAGMLVLEAQSLENPSVGGGSWRDLTRVAGADPSMWTQILEMNSGPVLSRVDALLDRLLGLRHALVRHDEVAIRAFFDQAREVKESLRCD